MIDDWVLPKVLERQAKAGSGRPFLDLVGGPSLGVGEIELSSRILANGLTEIGVRAGDRVVVLLPTCVEFVEAWFAINRLGAVLVPVNTAYKGDFLRHVMRNAGAGIAIVGHDHVARIVEIEAALPDLRMIVVVGGDRAPTAPGRAEMLPFAALRAGSERGIDVEVTMRDIGAIIYTSGTTGRSKGALLPHGHLYLDPHVYIDRLGLTPSDVMYTCLPLFHANALLLNVYGALILGSRVALSPAFSASRWIDEIRETGATVTNLLGVMTDFIYRQPPRPNDAENSLRIATAVPTSPTLGSAFEARFGLRLLELYGTTELNCPIVQPLDAPRRPGSCGTVVDEWFDCILADPETDLPVATGDVGELLVRPKHPWCISTGYRGMEEETLAAWRNLWFHTGDAMRQDQDGYFYFVDRLKDRIRRRGENVSPFEVEEVLLSHPAIAEAAVVGIRSPFDEHEQEVKACLVRRPEATEDAAAIAAHCADRMPDFAVPRFIEFYAELPKTPTQKVRRQELRDHGIRDRTWVSPHAAGRPRDNRS